MARNRGEPMKVPPPEPESSEEDDEEASTEGSVSQDSDSETEQTQTQTPAKPNQPPAPQPKEPSSSSEEEEESGSETESEPDDAPTSKAKPLATKPVVEKQKANDGASNARSKPNAPDPVTPTKSAAAKRPAGDGDASSKDSKKLKKADEAETSEKKNNLFQRLWSEEDEIAVLEGMIEYTSKKKADPVSDLSAFHDFIKQKLQLDATRTQLQDKIRRLKKKYENNKSKEKEGEEKTFSKPHELKSYDLSKRIWGNQNIKENGGAKVVGSPKSNGRVAKKTDSKKVSAAEREEANDVKNAMVVKEEKSPAAKRLKSDSVGASVEERMLAAGEVLVGEEEWEKLKEVEFELYLKQLEVKAAQTKLVLDAMKGRGH